MHRTTSESDGCALFDTAVGRCAVAWTNRGLALLQLPERSDAAALARVRRRFPDARQAEPPRAIRRAVDAVVALLDGEHRDLSHIVLDMTGLSEFPRRVYEVARTIGPGQTLSYAQVARRMGAPGAARAVGRALGMNPFAIVVPCHRVVAAQGKLGGFSAHGGVSTKRRLLEIEAPMAGVASRP